MTLPFIIGIGLVLVCGASGLAVVYYMGQKLDAKKAQIDFGLQQQPEHWATELLDPKFSTRGFFARYIRFGDLKIWIMPDGVMMRDGSTYYFLYRDENNPLVQLADKAFSLDFMAMDEGYVWLQGGEGKFQVHGGVSRVKTFLHKITSWNWEVYDGVPKGTEKPKRYKG